MQKIFLLLALSACIITTFAQSKPDSAATLSRVSPLKTMTYTQYSAYTNGVDLYNLDTVAILNHYPTATKVLADKKALNLDAGQLAKIMAINTNLSRKKKEMGAFIIKNETVLDSLFRTRKIDDGTLIFYTNRFGLYQAELRNAILQAALQTRALLTAQQLIKYEQLHRAE